MSGDGVLAESKLIVQDDAQATPNGAGDAHRDDARRHESRSHQAAAVIPVDDPISTLPETAVRVLEAAQRVLRERGFAALTLNTVAAEAGENKAMTAYYFGNKAGLVAALVDAVIHDECLDAASHMRSVKEEERLDRLVAELQRMSATTDDFQAFFDILPHALRSEELRRRLATLYEWYIQLKLDWLGVDRADEERRQRVRGLAQLMAAAIDGLAIQALIDPQRFAVEPAFDAFRQLLERGLPEMLES
jgi:AcrR family transcriptional regulator